MSGYIVYGTVATQTQGAVIAAPTGTGIKPAASHAEYGAMGMLEDLAMVPVHWKQNASDSTLVAFS